MLEVIFFGMMITSALVGLYCTLCYLPKRQNNTAQTIKRLEVEVQNARARGDHFYTQFQWAMNALRVVEEERYEELVRQQGCEHRGRSEPRILRVKHSEPLSREETDDILFSIMLQPSPPENEEDNHVA